MGIVSFDGATGGYWLDNGIIKCRVKPSSMVDQLTLLSLPRNVGYYYPYFSYYTENDTPGSFYLHTLGNFTITPTQATPTISVALQKVYTDVNGVVHLFQITVSLTDGHNQIKVEFQDSASVGFKKVQLNMEANLYPQGYAVQGAGGKANAGGELIAPPSDALPYDGSTYAFLTNGDIQKDAVTQRTSNLVDGFLCFYSADCSVGLYGHYVDINKLRILSLAAGDERQYGWLDMVPYPVTKTRFKVEFFFGAWADPSEVSCQAAYAALPLTEVPYALPSAEYNKIVRTDLNAQLYDYHAGFSDVLGNITAKLGTATLVPAGTPSFKFYKHRGYPSTWNTTVQDLREDFIWKSITMARESNKRLFVEIDILDGIWNTADPTNKAIEQDEVTQSYYWPKLHRLITPGELYHDAFMEHVTYLCENYNFYGIVLSECSFKHVDFSAEAKALFLADNPSYTDWPRKADLTIDLENETLGKWKTGKLSALWDEIKAIAEANSKRFFLMVEPNFWDADRQAWEYGQYWPEAIKHCHGLWVWGYYGVFEVDPLALENVVVKLNALKTAYPSKENIISIGLWGPVAGAISAAELKAGLDALNLFSWPATGQGIEVTPSKHMSVDYWNMLWGDYHLVPSPVRREFYTLKRTSKSLWRRYWRE